MTLASPIAAQLFGRSLFDIQLAKRGLDLSAGRGRALLQSARLKHLLSQDCVTLQPSTRIDDAVAILGHGGHGEAYLVDDKGRYRGSVTLADLEVMRERDRGRRQVRDCPRTPRPVLGPEASVWEAMHQLQDITGEAIAVVDDKAGDAFLGVVYEASIARAYLQHSEALRREEHGTG